MTTDSFHEQRPDSKPVDTEHSGERAQNDAGATLEVSGASEPSGSGNPPDPLSRLARMDAPGRAQGLLRMQQQHGNAFVQRLVQKSAPVVQRDGGTPAAPNPATPTQDPKLPKFVFSKLSGGLERFDYEYTPVGPTPAKGTLKITLRVSIDFKDFDWSMVRSPAFKAYFEKHAVTSEQLRDFKWTETEKKTKRTEFGADFASKVHDAWSGKHDFFLKETGFSEYACNLNVVVEIVEDPAKAHNKMKLQKVPKGVDARFRSFVSGNTSTLDPRDAKDDGKPRDDPGFGRAFVDQIEPFGFDSAVLTSDLASQVSAIAGRMRPMQSATQVDTLLGDDWAVDLTGRASAKGEKSYNDKLGMQRAQAVEAQLKSELARPGARSRALSKGEEHASEDAHFQRVDIQVWNVPKAMDPSQPKITQNTAAHEAGHMFGLDDEYEEEVPEKNVKGKFKGDKPGDGSADSEYEKVKALMGQEAADELRVADSSNIMSQGMEVKRGHYVYFLEALNNATSKKWSVG